MILLPGYNISKDRYSSNRRVFYDGERKQDKTPVIIKTHFSGPEGSMDQVRLRHEYELLKELNCKGVIKPYVLETYPNGLALILEHMDGLPLSEYISTKTIDLTSFLKIAISITEAISELHRHHIIHKDIQPENILINTLTHQIWFVDFRFATVLPKENPQIINPATIEGALAYMSPEQTGRMHRALDYRTDFYSLGILLYQMLTGHLPFESTDPLELVHSHLAMQPALPCETNPEIPIVVSDIIMKLLSKNAEERYQSSRGLIEDFKKCRLQLKKNNKTEIFPLAEKDFPEKFQISQKIYGREHETRMLLDMFERASRGSMEMAVISGNPGVGKTSLVQQIQVLIPPKKGIFIAGKFDPVYQNVPYSALANAFQRLIKQLLTESEEELNKWKEKLLGVLGEYGQIIIDLIPEVGLIIGDQPPVKPMDSTEFHNLINRIKMDFIRVFSSPEHPLVIFLDDLQWVDTSTLRLIEEMITDQKMQHLFLIVSYRDNEVNDAHPLAITLENLIKEKFEFSRMLIAPLRLEDIVRLTSDTLNVAQRSVAALSELLLRKTGGNPFFISQFLNTLYQENLLVLDAKDNFWQWDFQAIKQMDFTDNIIELLIQRLERMPADTRQILMMAACIGSRFDLKMLLAFTEYGDSEIIRHLLPAIREDLLVTSSEQIFNDLPSDAASIITQTFRFRHDRIRQACYSLITDENKKVNHQKIGHLLLDNIYSFQKDEEIFEIIHHLNIGADLNRKQQERDELAELNLIAGIRSMALAAFEPAFNYFENGIRLLDEKSWKRQYNLTLKLYSKCAEAARLCVNFEEMAILFNAVLQNANSVLDQVDVYENKIHALISENRRSEALEMAWEILKEIGMDLPDQPTRDNVQSILEKTANELSQYKIDDLLNLPEMKDTSKLAAMKVIGAVIGSAYQLSLDRFVILICQQMKLSVRFGIFSNSATSFAFFGVFICEYIGDIEMGYRLGRLGLKLLKRFKARELEAKVYIIFYAMLHHRKNHFQDSSENLLAGYYSGLETGDYEFGNYNAAAYCACSLFTGKSLDTVDREMARLMDNIRQHKQLASIIYVSIFYQTLLNLLEKKDEPCLLNGEIYNEHTMLPLHQKTGDHVAIFIMNLNKTMLCYMFGKYKEAISHANEAEKVVTLVPGFFFVSVHPFFSALSQLAVYDKLTDEEQSSALTKVEAIQSKMKIMMKHAPMNYEHRFYLVDAELARVLGKNHKAATSYNHAIRLARENNYTNDEALSCELAAKFMLKQEQHEFAETFMQRAYSCYLRWGALQKAEHLYEQYPQTIKRPRLDTRDPENKTSIDGHHQVEYSQDGLDLATLLKASQTIASEMVLDKLLIKMMRIVIENTGAERGFLILNIDDQLRVSARGYVESEKVLAQSFDPVDMGTEELSVAVIQYVARTKEYVVLHNASTDDQFRAEPYIRKHLPKSILCIPIIYKSILTGIIYLENRMTPDVFSSDRTELVNLLTSQIAISIENTRLFDTQKKAEEKYRGIFENAVEGIFLSTPDGRFVSANPATAQILGYDSSEELAEKINNIPSQLYVSPPDREKFLRLLRKNEKIENFETQFQCKDGSSIWVSLNARSIYNDNGVLDLIEGFIVDITQQKAAADAQRMREENLRKENIRLRSDIKDRYKFGRIIGKSVSMQDVYELILKAAATDAAVIIYGESGTGKELVARAIHETSDRKKGHFVPVNCGAIPENLLESEFFGYKKGAFTGARTDRNGFMDHAHEGTLFLDELGEIDLHFQVKLLRVLEDGSYTPLGDQAVKNSDARVVAATSRNLQEAIQNGLMREDFFYRIHVIPIHLPPLRERQEDIPLLVEHFLKIHSSNDEAPVLSGKIIEELRSHKWPGNVRELQNVLQRYCTLGTLDFLSNSGIVYEPDESTLLKNKEVSSGKNSNATVAVMEKKMIIDALAQNQWNRQRAAKQLDINIRSFYRKLKKYDIIQTR